MEPIGCTWDELPLLVSIDDAAKLAGVSRDEIERLVNDAKHPLPHHKVGRVTKVSTRLMPAYMEELCLQ